MQNAGRTMRDVWAVAVIAAALAGCNGAKPEQTPGPEPQEPSGLGWTHGSRPVTDGVDHFVEIRLYDSGQTVDALEIVLPETHQLDDVWQVDLGPVPAVRIDGRQVDRQPYPHVLRIVAAQDGRLAIALEATSERPFEIRDTDGDGTAEVVTYDDRQAVIYRFENGRFQQDVGGS